MIVSTIEIRVPEATEKPMNVRLTKPALSIRMIKRR